MKPYTLLVWLCCLAANTGLAQTPPAGQDRALTVPTISIAPYIDGKLIPAEWATATVGGDFWLSTQQRWPSERTEVLVMADVHNLYVAFRCYDEVSSEVHAVQRRRDADFGFDDYVAIELDPHHSHRDIVAFAVNAVGSVRDSSIAGRAQKIEWKGDWQAAVTTTQYGWSAEFAIPFRMLDRTGTEGVFGVNFVRHHHRTRELSHWADVSPNHSKDQMGQLVGLNVAPGGNVDTWQVMTYALAGKNVADQNKVHDSVLTAGVDIRYRPTPAITALVSANPDFSQVESQVTDIDFSYNEKVLDDPRPFFQEGARHFGDDDLYFYSNRIPDFDVGGKSFGRFGNYSYAALATQSDESRRDYVARLEHEFDATTSVAVMAAGTEQREFDNQFFLLELQGKRDSGLFYELDMATTHTNGDLVESPTDGTAVLGRAGWELDHWVVGADYRRLEDGFLPANGLIRQDEIGTEGIRPYISYARDFDNKPVRTVDGYISYHHRDTLAGQSQTRTFAAGASVELKQRVRISLDYSEGDYRPSIGAFGQFSADLLHDRFWNAGLDFNTRSDRLGYGLGYSDGFLGGDDYRRVYVYAWARPVDRLYLNLSSEYVESFGSLDQTILVVGWDINAHSGISGRYITADGHSYYRLAYRRQVADGVDIFAVYDNTPFLDTELSLKLIWSF